MTPTELLDHLERDGILTVAAQYTQTDQAIVRIDKNHVGQLVEFLGVTRQFCQVAWTLMDDLRSLQDRSWDDGDLDLADQLATWHFAIGTRWHTGPIVTRAVRAFYGQEVTS